METETLNTAKEAIADMLEEENEELVEVVSTLQQRLDILESIKDECLKTISQLTSEKNELSRNLREMTMFCVAVSGVVFSYGLFYGVYFGCK